MVFCFKYKNNKILNIFRFSDHKPILTVNLNVNLLSSFKVALEMNLTSSNQLNGFLSEFNNKLLKYRVSYKILEFNEKAQDSISKLIRLFLNFNLKKKLLKEEIVRNKNN